MSKAAIRLDESPTSDCAAGDNGESKIEGQLAAGEEVVADSVSESSQTAMKSSSTSTVEMLVILLVGGAGLYIRGAGATRFLDGS